MAEIAPFRGIRYNLEAISLEDVTSPPYDVISPADNEYFHKRHPKNVVRLILGKESPDDSPSDNRFTRAAAYLQEWLAEGTLKRDDEPAFYAYEQHYDLCGQPKTVRGLIALVKLHEYADGVVLPHEDTLARPKSDLARLIRQTKANLDTVYALYPDADHIVDGVLDRTASTPPAAKAGDRDGVRHRLWMIRSQSDIDLITRALASKQIVIADGHHRYETALAYRREMREREGDPDGARPYDYVMMTLVNVYTPDVAVLPTHRLARGLQQEALDGLEASLGEHFELVESSSQRLGSDMEAHDGRAIGIYRPGRACLAIVRRDTTGLIPAPPAVQNLDVLILHHLILHRILGIDAERLRQEANVGYTRDEREAIRAVDRGEFQIAFLLSPIKLEAMLEAARAGYKMPQKATYFYPKLLSGLVMRKIE